MDIIHTITNLTVMLYTYPFLMSLIVAVPLSITRGRILLKVLVWLGGISLFLLSLLTLWAPMTLIGSYIVFPFLIPSFTAGLVIFLITGAKTTQSIALRAIVSLALIVTPFALHKVSKSYANDTLASSMPSSIGLL